MPKQSETNQPETSISLTATPLPTTNSMDPPSGLTAVTTVDQHLLSTPATEEEPQTPDNSTTVDVTNAGDGERHSFRDTLLPHQNT